MALSIKDPEADSLAREVARLTGESLTEVVVVSLRERLARTKHAHQAPLRKKRLRRLRAEFAQLRVIDPGAGTELAYDDAGAPR